MLKKNRLYSLLLFFSGLINLYFLSLFFPVIKNKILRYHTQLSSNADLETKESFDILEKDIFKDPIIGDSFYFPTIRSNEDLGNLIRKLSIPICDFDSIYNKIKIISVGYWKKDIFQVQFNIDRDTLSAFAYVKRSKTKTNSAFCQIPSSGISPSIKIFDKNNGNSESDTNGDDIMQNFGDVYILIKLNESCLAIHNGEYKISYNNLVPIMINKSSSYSYYYILCSVALTKYLKLNYDFVGVFGMSQGGYGALINSLITEPDVAIVASGYSKIFDDINISSINQLIYPGIEKVTASDTLLKRIQQLNTKYLFTYGKNDDDVYYIEARSNLTAQHFKNLSNVSFFNHESGHCFDQNIMSKFILNSNLFLKANSK